MSWSSRDEHLVAATLALQLGPGDVLLPPLPFAVHLGGDRQVVRGDEVEGDRGDVSRLQARLHPVEKPASASPVIATRSKVICQRHISRCAVA